MKQIVLTNIQPKLFKKNLFYLCLSLLWVMGLDLSFSSDCQAMLDWDIQGKVAAGTKLQVTKDPEWDETQQSWCAEIQNKAEPTSKKITLTPKLDAVQFMPIIPANLPASLTDFVNLIKTTGKVERHIRGFEFLWDSMPLILRAKGEDIWVEDPLVYDIDCSLKFNLNRRTHQTFAHIQLLAEVDGQPYVCGETYTKSFSHKVHKTNNEIVDASYRKYEDDRIQLGAIKKSIIWNPECPATDPLWSTMNPPLKKNYETTEEDEIPEGHVSYLGQVVHCTIVPEESNAPTPTIGHTYSQEDSSFDVSSYLYCDGVDLFPTQLCTETWKKDSFYYQACLTLKGNKPIKVCDNVQIGGGTFGQGVYKRTNTGKQASQKTETWQELTDKKKLHKVYYPEALDSWYSDKKTMPNGFDQEIKARFISEGEVVHVDVQVEDDTLGGSGVGTIERKSLPSFDLYSDGTQLFVTKSYLETGKKDDLSYKATVIIRDNSPLVIDTAANIDNGFFIKGVYKKIAENDTITHKIRTWEKIDDKTKKYKVQFPKALTTWFGNKHKIMDEISKWIRLNPTYPKDGIVCINYLQLEAGAPKIQNQTARTDCLYLYSDGQNCFKTRFYTETGTKDNFGYQAEVILKHGQTQNGNVIDLLEKPKPVRIDLSKDKKSFNQGVYRKVKTEDGCGYLPDDAGWIKVDAKVETWQLMGADQPHYQVYCDPRTYNTDHLAAYPFAVPEAQYQLGLKHEKGDGVPKNEQEAAKWFNLAAQQGELLNANSQYQLGLKYEKGESVSKYEKEAVRLFTLAAYQGHLLNAEIQYQLGLKYEKGERVPKNVPLANTLFSLIVADQGQLLNADAQYNLGLRYEKGEGVSKDEQEAVKWFILAAANGNAYSQYNLGLRYEKGNGVDKDEQEAVKWIQNAAANGNADAQYNLGLRYEKGNGVVKGEQEALKWFILAAQQGHFLNPDAQYALAVGYKKGQGCSKDDKEAIKWLQKAAENGLAEAQYNLGLKYEKGEEVSKNLQEARKWLEKAAKNGIAEAYYSLGLIIRDKTHGHSSHSTYTKMFRLGAEIDKVKGVYYDNIKMITLGDVLEMRSNVECCLCFYDQSKSCATTADAQYKRFAWHPSHMGYRPGNWQHVETKRQAAMSAIQKLYEATGEWHSRMGTL
ncbi:MAG: hypothetical protein Q8929_02200 [Bacillota bacterium]|nr:hypothetical protein [Bacillota bacterium]